MDYKSLMGYGNKKKIIKEGTEVGTRDGVCCHDCKIEGIIDEIIRG